jgi:phosphoribosylanthranilate isomerase
MAVSVKICGITEGEALDAALRAGADFVGFAFHPTSPRNLPYGKAADLALKARGRARIVALLVDPDDAAVERAVNAIQPDFVQLHGRESPQRLADLRSCFGRPLIKALAVAEAEDLRGVARYEPVADMFLFDAQAPKGATRPGGHGLAFDWRLLQHQRIGRPWLLAGGLNPDNVALALSVSGAPGVDVSSGVEVKPGIKDPQLIQAFVAAARGVLPQSVQQGSSA